MEKIIYQISTHWDREWYRPFQGFRYYLVEMVDTLLEALETGRIPEFVFDGQIVVIEDYLEIRPENRGRIEKLLQEKKLKVGPWYAMPDEFLVSGESLVENFLVGQKTAKEFGTDIWKFGYVSDIFGHIAQLPQILNGFGINGAFIGRGIHTQYSNGSHLLWKGANGSECYVCKDNYATFKRDFDHAENPEDAIIGRINNKPPKFPLVLNYCDDHAVIDENTDRFLSVIQKDIYENVGGLENFGEIMEEYHDELPIIEGELGDTAYLTDDFRAVTNSLSSYYPLKQKNDYIECRLYQEMGPLMVMAEMEGKFFDKRPFFEIARKYLLKNQPHDSICGCSVDAVHKDMPYRYSQAETIANVFRDEFKKKFFERKNVEDNFDFWVLNTDLHERKGVVKVIIDFPLNWTSVYEDNTFYQKYNKFSIFNQEGEEVSYQILKIEKSCPTYERQEISYVDQYTVVLDTVLKSFGFTKFSVRPRKFRCLVPPVQPNGVLKAENEYIRLAVDNDGKLTIQDKESGETYKELLWFVDDVDSGNGWFHGGVNFDSPTVSSQGASTRIEVIHMGQLANTFRIKKIMEVPAYIEIDEYKRAEQYVDMEIVTDVTLYKGTKYIECETKLINLAKQHRLRLLLPTEIAGEDYQASQAFCFVNRKRGISAEGYNGREPEYTEKNTSGIVSINNKISFVGAGGFHEGGVYPDGTISMTMFRSVEKNFQEPHSETATLIGEMTFRYAIALHMNECEQLHLQKKLQNEMICVSADKTIGRIAENKMELSDERIILSVIKPAENNIGWIVRMYNPLAEFVKCDLLIHKNVYITEVDLSEQPISQTEYQNKKSFTFRQNEIKTVLIKN